MRVRAFTGGGFAENGYLAVCVESGVAVLVDPGGSAPQMTAAVEAEGLELAAVLLTHAHLDHIEGVHVVRAAFPSAPIWLHPHDRALYMALPRQAAAFGLPMPAEQPVPDQELAHGQRLSFGSSAFEVRHTPGHAAGHVIFVAEGRELALVGDVIFQGSIGRTDLPGGDFYTLMRSIREQVLTLPDDAVLYPGHGPTTTVRDERLGNPFLVPQFGGEMA
jgi:glyoxylase-like metal-dependent hydrolase (beta-lactamase superfamily II)